MSWLKVMAVAERQRGLVTTAQLEAQGLDRQALRWARESNKLKSVLPRVHQLVGAPTSWDSRALAALLSAGGGAALSHGTAAMLYGLPGFDWDAQATIELTVPWETRLTLPDDYLVHRTTRPVTPWSIRKLAVTRLARTLLDLAATIDEERLEIALDGAHLRFKRFGDWLKEELKDLDPRVPGVAPLKALLAVRTGPPAESPHETRIRRRIRHRGVTPPTHQLVVSDEQGPIMRIDEAWPLHRVAVHGDSYLWHADRRTFDADAHKRSRLAALGWLSIVVTKTSLEDDEWLKLLERTLEQRNPQLRLFGDPVSSQKGAVLTAPLRHPSAAAGA